MMPYGKSEQRAPVALPIKKCRYLISINRYVVRMLPETLSTATLECFPSLGSRKILYLTLKHYPTLSHLIPRAIAFTRRQASRRRERSDDNSEVDPDRETAGAASQGVSLPVSMSAPIAVGATAGLKSLRFTSSISNPLLVVVPVGMWAKASISPLSELAREAGEAQPVGNADRPHIHRPFW